MGGKRLLDLPAGEGNRAESERKVALHLSCGEVSPWTPRIWGSLKRSQVDEQLGREASDLGYIDVDFINLFLYISRWIVGSQ